MRIETIGNPVVGHDLENTFRALNRQQNLEADPGIYIMLVRGEWPLGKNEK